MKIKKNVLFIILMLFVIFSPFYFLNPVLYAEGQTSDQKPSMGQNEDHADRVKIHFFYSKDCDSCVRIMEILHKKERDFPKIKSIPYELSEKNNAALLFYLFDSMDVDELDYAIPIIFMEEHVFFGEDAFIQRFDGALEEVLRKNDLQDQPARLIEKYSMDSLGDEGMPEKNYIKIPVVIAASLADSINPCAIGVIIILISSMIASKNRRYALMAGMIYIAVIFVVYFLLGIGFIYLARNIQIPKLFFTILGIILIFFGLFSLKDFFWYGKGLSLGIPAPIKKIIEKNIYKATIVSILLIGVLISIFEATCSGAVYFGILSMISQSGLTLHSLLLLLLYNFIFILPLLIILLLFYFGIPARKVQRLLIQKNRRIYRLILGLMLILLGIYLIVML